MTSYNIGWESALELDVSVANQLIEHLTEVHERESTELGKLLKAVLGRK